MCIIKRDMNSISGQFGEICLYPKTLNPFQASINFTPFAPSPPQIHMPNNIFTITLSKIDLMKDAL